MKLYANNELPIPAIEIEADDLYEAAALGLKHFRAWVENFIPTLP